MSQFESTVDKRIQEATAPFLTLHSRVDDMERRVNERLREMLVPDLAVFQATLEKVKADIRALQSQQIGMPSNPMAEESEEEASLIEITRKLVEKKKEKTDKKDKDK